MFISEFLEGVEFFDDVYIFLNMNDVDCGFYDIR